MKKIKQFWNWLLGKTTIDEKAIEVFKEAKSRANEMSKEFKDVINASKGKKRRGRPKNKK